MAKYAIIENNEVINVIVADAKFIKEAKIAAIECAEEVCSGWKFIDNEFIAPEPIYNLDVDDSQTM